MTKQLAACYLSLFNWILCSTEAVLPVAAAHMPDLEAQSTIIQQV